MSKYEQRDNSGSLFKNERKEKETHADYRGDCMIDGTAYYMDAWIKTAESGRKWMSFSFKPKGATPKPDTRTHAERKKPTLIDMDNDVPF